MTPQFSPADDIILYDDTKVLGQAKKYCMHLTLQWAPYNFIALARSHNFSDFTNRQLVCHTHASHNAGA